jgi:hypothetical protein
MKKIIIIASLLMITQLSFGQNSNLGVTAGLNFAHGGFMGSLISWGSTLSPDYSVNSKTGFQIGLINDRSFKNPNWGMQYGLSFMRIGIEEKGRDRFGTWSREMRLSSFHFRGDFHYKLCFGDVALLPQAGFFWNYFVRYRIISSDGTGDQSGFGVSYPIPGIAFGLTSMFGEKFQIGLSYNLGIISNYTKINFAYFFRK